MKNVCIFEYNFIRVEEDVEETNESLDLSKKCFLDLRCSFWYNISFKNLNICIFGPNFISSEKKKKSWIFIV